MFFNSCAANGQYFCIWLPSVCPRFFMGVLDWLVGARVRGDTRFSGGAVLAVPEYCWLFAAECEVPVDQRTCTSSVLDEDLDDARAYAVLPCRTG